MKSISLKSSILGCIIGLVLGASSGTLIFGVPGAIIGGGLGASLFLLLFGLFAMTGSMESSVPHPGKRQLRAVSTLPAEWAEQVNALDREAPPPRATTKVRP